MCEVNKPSVRVARVSTPLLYYHYRCDGHEDSGWGCAYRSLQTLLSNLLFRGYLQRPVPTIPEIQEVPRARLILVI